MSLRVPAQFGQPHVEPYGVARPAQQAFARFVPHQGVNNLHGVGAGAPQLVVALEVARAQSGLAANTHRGKTDGAAVRVGNASEDAGALLRTQRLGYMKQEQGEHEAHPRQSLKHHVGV